MYQQIIASAYYYAKLGLPIIPLCSHDHQYVTPKHKQMCKCPGKIPLIAGWQTRTETRDEHIDEWISQFKKFNIGLPLGSNSGFCGIDIDGEEGEKILQELSGGDLPPTWEFTTGNGRRLLYRIPVGIPTKKFTKTGEGIHQECAILCQGQQTVLPPSIHVSGKRYEWVEGKSLRDIDCAEAPKWLIELIRQDSPNINSKTTPGAQEIKIDLTEIDTPLNVDNLLEEFQPTEFNDEIPEEIKNLRNITAKVKTQKAPGSNVADILYQVVTEGSRDNTMTAVIGHFLSKPEYRQMPKEMFINLMLDYNRRYCDPPLEDEAVITKVNHFLEIEAQKTAQYKEMKSEKKFQATEAANMVLNLIKTHEQLMIDYELRTNTFYTCNPQKGPWKARHGSYLQAIRALVRKYLRLPQYGDPSWDKEHNINETIAAIKDLLLSKSAYEDISFDLHANQESLRKYIVVDGQLLDWLTGELLPWDPTYRATINFDIGYDPDADCPHWRQYMEQWIPDEGARQLLQEFFGYCLIPDTKLESFLILTGSGSNGKSMMLNFIKKIFGDACSSLSTSKMVERFGKAALYGKLINICTEDEGEGGYLKHTDEIKAIVSGEEIVAEFKGKDPFKFRSTARLVFATNNIPRTRDRSFGWYRRQIIINFPNRFKKDMNIAREMEYWMEKEKAGIFNWLLEGLRRVMLRGNLEIPESVMQSQEEFKAINDPLEGFIKECTRPITEEDIKKFSLRGSAKRIGISTTLLYKVYEFWCKDNFGEKAKQLQMVQRNFTERLHKEKGIPKDRGYCIITQNNKQQCFFGIILDIKDPDMEERLINEFHGYGAIEPEYKIREFVMNNSNQARKIFA